MTDNLSTFLSTFAGTLTSDASEVHGNALQASISRLTPEEYAEAMMMVRGKVLELIEERQGREVLVDVMGAIQEWEVEL